LLSCLDPWGDDYGIGICIICKQEHLIDWQKIQVDKCDRTRQKEKDTRDWTPQSTNPVKSHLNKDLSRVPEIGSTSPLFGYQIEAVTPSSNIPFVLHRTQTCGQAPTKRNRLPFVAQSPSLKSTLCNGKPTLVRCI
jgi:hypothetical protein